MKYTLTRQDKKLALKLARARNRGKSNDSFNGKATPKQKVADNYRGLLGEIAFARTFGLEVNRTISPSGDDGYDFTLKDGITVDVKHRSKRGNDLALESDSLDDFTADVLVLAWSKNPVELVGWITKVRMAFVGVREEWSTGWKLYARPRDLLPMERLYTLAPNPFPEPDEVFT